MADMGLLEADDQRAELRQAQPMRHLTAQHPALGVTGDALAGDDKHEGQAIVMRALQKAEQHPMRAHLRHAVQIEPRVDFAAAF